MKLLVDVVQFFANLFAIGASGIAIYLYVFKRKQISTVFNTLLGYASQLTLTELTGKLDRLNDLNARDDDQQDEIVAVLHEITGQIKGNPKLTPHFLEVRERITRAISGKRKLSEPAKRAFVSEIRERIRHASVLNMENTSKD